VQFGPRGAVQAAGVVAGGQRLAAEVAGEFHQVLELHRLVAADAGDRRLAAGVAVGEILDHGGAEALLPVQHVVGDVERVGDAARVVDVLAGAAGALLLHGGAMVVELQRGADHLVAGFLHQPRNDGAVHTARHGNQDPHVAALSPICQNSASSRAALAKSAERLAKRAAPPWLSPSASSRAAEEPASAWYSAPAYIAIQDS